MDAEYIEKYLRVVDFYKVDTNKLSDIVHAVVMSDMLSGSNRQELDIDRLYSRDMDANLCEVWKLNNTSDRLVLPDVQLLRIMCDSLFIILNMQGVNIANTYLTSEASKNVFRVVTGKSISGDVYRGEEECRKCLNKFVETCVSVEGFEWVRDFDDLLKRCIAYIEPRIEPIASFENSLKSAWRDIKVPVDSEFLKRGVADYSGVENVKTHVLDNIIFAFEVDIRERYAMELRKNSVGALYHYNEAIKQMDNPCIGTYSMTNACPMISSRIKYDKEIINVKLARLYSVGKAYSFMDFGTLMSLYCMFMSRCGHADYADIRDFVERTVLEYDSFRGI